MAIPQLSPEAARGAAPARAPDHPAPPVPLLPEGYRVEETLRADPGSGTAIARDRATGERVFVKWSSEPDRLTREAAILKALDHPAIVRLRALRRGADQGVLVLDLVDGQSLEAVCAQAGGRLDGQALTSLARDLADALGAIHRAGFVHRDLKPGNVVVQSDGRPVIVDLGAALPLAEAREAPPESLLTDGYAAPEQYLTDQPEGPWTDVYGLGALCYRALTGRAPPPAPQRLRGAAMSSALDAEGDCPAPLRRAIDRALALPARERPQDIAAWVEMLGKSDAAPEGPAPAVTSDADDGPPTVQVRRVATRRLRTPPGGDQAEPLTVTRRRQDVLPWALLLALLMAALGMGAWYGPSWYERHVKTEWLVDPEGGGDTTTIGEALTRAGDGATIRVRPGSYAESLVLGRPLHLIAAVREQPPTIVPPEGPCIAATGDGGSITGLALRAPAPADPDAPASPCLLISAPSLLVEANRIESAAGPAVLVRAGVAPLMRANLIVDSVGPGLVAADGARGRFEDNTFENVAGLALIVRGGAAPEIIGNAFQASGGALFTEGAGGRFAGNRMVASQGSAIRVARGADPEVVDNLIEDPAEAGVYVYERGKGRFTGNTIVGSRLSGVVVAEGATVELSGNTIRDGAEHGVLVVDDGRALLEDNTITDNQGHGIALGWDADVELNGNRVEGNTEPQVLDARQG